MLPAILSLLGDRIEALRVPLFGRLAQADSAPHGGVWGRIVDQVMRRPVIALTGAVIALLVCGDPLLQHPHGLGRARQPARSTLAKQGFLALDRDFTVGDIAPAMIVVDGATATRPLRDGPSPAFGSSSPATAASGRSSRS